MLQFSQLAKVLVLISIVARGQVLSWDQLSWSQFLIKIRPAAPPLPSHQNT